MPALILSEFNSRECVRDVLLYRTQSHYYCYRISKTGIASIEHLLFCCFYFYFLTVVWEINYRNIEKPLKLYNIYISFVFIFFNLKHNAPISKHNWTFDIGILYFKVILYYTIVKIELQQLMNENNYTSSS